MYLKPTLDQSIVIFLLWKNLKMPSTMGGTMVFKQCPNQAKNSVKWEENGDGSDRCVKERPVACCRVHRLLRRPRDPRLREQIGARRFRQKLRRCRPRPLRPRRRCPPRRWSRRPGTRPSSLDCRPASKGHYPMRQEPASGLHILTGFTMIRIVQNMWRTIPNMHTTTLPIHITQL